MKFYECVSTKQWLSYRTSEVRKNCVRSKCDAVYTVQCTLNIKNVRRLLGTVNKIRATTNKQEKYQITAKKAND